MSISNSPADSAIGIISLKYGIAIAVGILILIFLIMFASYACPRVKLSGEFTPSSSSNGTTHVTPRKGRGLRQALEKEAERDQGGDYNRHKACTRERAQVHEDSSAFSYGGEDQVAKVILRRNYGSNFFGLTPKALEEEQIGCSPPFFFGKRSKKLIKLFT
ncbi:hypothetical protein RND71_000997 [Anisodus tanguticus]|uniref:Uncharacterized protein n=1 Tax=Anisodus tanguticus TaxID=243964 RepID=A0AAE1VY74_9SOLA|nr:hypothetical protein RND71_000997 [Anisodus tanguticus]